MHQKLLRFRSVVPSDKRIGSSRSTYLSSDSSDDDRKDLMTPPPLPMVTLATPRPRSILKVKNLKDEKMQMKGKNISSDSDSDSNNK